MMDAAPGRHTAGFGPTQFFGYLLNSAGYCMHGNIGVVRPERKLEGYLNAVTGWGQTWEEMLKSGERIGTLRHLFTLRENDNPLKRQVHGRIIGRPPQKAGPLAGVTTNLEAQIYWNLGALDWDPVTTRPSKKKLLELGLNDIAGELYG